LHHDEASRSAINEKRGHSCGYPAMPRPCIMQEDCRRVQTVPWLPSLIFAVRVAPWSQVA
jgi:hypothetical protein